MHSSYWGRKKIFQTYSLSFIGEKWYNLHICHEIWAQSYWEQLQGGERDQSWASGWFLDPVFTIYNMHEAVEDLEDRMDCRKDNSLNGWERNPWVLSGVRSWQLPQERCQHRLWKCFLCSVLQRNGTFYCLTNHGQVASGDIWLCHQFYLKTIISKILCSFLAQEWFFLFSDVVIVRCFWSQALQLTFQIWSAISCSRIQHSIFQVMLEHSRSAFSIFRLCFSNLLFSLP